MKRLNFLALFFIAFTFCLSGCKKQPDLLDYISENRTGIYLYSDDSLTIKIYSGIKESPYSADGICGKTENFTEIFVYFSENPSNAEICVGDIVGEMNYNSVKNCFYLCEGVKLNFEEYAPVTLKFNKKEAEYTATNMISNSVIGFEAALNCAVEYDGEGFGKLIKNDLFDGEIYIRLLYDEGCYYYVGVCDKSGKIKAYLIDGERGKVIAERQSG